MCVLHATSFPQMQYRIQTYHYSINTAMENSTNSDLLQLRTHHAISLPLYSKCKDKVQFRYFPQNYYFVKQTPVWMIL